MVELGIEVYIADKVEEEGEWFDMDDRSQWGLAWDYLYDEDGKGGQGTILSYVSDYFKELEISETTELNDIYETYNLMDELMESDRTLIRGIYDSGEWSGSLIELIKLIKNVRLQEV